MHEAPLKGGEDPDRLSFLRAVRVVRRLDPVAERQPLLAGVQDEAADEALAGLVSQRCEAAGICRRDCIGGFDHPLPPGLPRGLLGSDPQGGGDGAASEDPDRLHADVPHAGGLSAGAFRVPLVHGFSCRPCGHEKAWYLQERGLYECAALPLPEFSDRSHSALLHACGPAQVVPRDLAAGLHEEDACGGRVGLSAGRDAQDRLACASQDHRGALTSTTTSASVAMASTAWRDSSDDLAAPALVHAAGDRDWDSAGRRC